MTDKQIRDRIIGALSASMMPMEMEAECVAFLDRCVAADRNVGNNWIPVTERLPEYDLPKDSKVKQIKALVAYKTNGRWVVRTQTRVKGYWYGAPDQWDWVKTSDPITHWMPLPEPPKEGQKNEPV